MVMTTAISCSAVAVRSVSSLRTAPTRLAALRPQTTRYTAVCVVVVRFLLRRASVDCSHVHWRRATCTDQSVCCSACSALQVRPGVAVVQRGHASRGAVQTQSAVELFQLANEGAEISTAASVMFAITLVVRTSGQLLERMRGCFGLKQPA